MGGCYGCVEWSRADGATSAWRASGAMTLGILRTRRMARKPMSRDADRALERARLHYNLVATKYNAAIASVPGSILAGLAGFKRAELLEAEPASGAGSPSA